MRESPDPSVCVTLEPSPDANVRDTLARGHSIHIRRVGELDDEWHAERTELVQERQDPDPGRMAEDRKSVV